MTENQRHATIGDGEYKQRACHQRNAGSECGGLSQLSQIFAFTCKLVSEENHERRAYRRPGGSMLRDTQRASLQNCFHSEHDDNGTVCFPRDESKGDGACRRNYKDRAAKTVIICEYSRRAVLDLKVATT